MFRWLIEGGRNHTSCGEYNNIQFLEGEFNHIVIGKKDTIVFMYPGYLTREHLEILQKEAKGAFPGMKCVILDGGLKIGAIKADEQTS